jgi:hypothetical protein
LIFFQKLTSGDSAMNEDPAMNGGVWMKKRKVSIFASIHQLHSLNQSQDNFFMLRKYAQSISCIKLPQMDTFRAKKKISIFAPIHRIHSLNQGQGSVFMLRECNNRFSIVSPHKFTPYWSFLI